MVDESAEGSDSKTQSRKVLFVRNLPYTTNDKDLEDAFSEYGPTKRCFVVRDKGAKDTCRGFGYVTFALAEDAQNAMDSMKTFKGRQIKISAADKKPRHQKRNRDKNTENTDKDNLSQSDEEKPETDPEPSVKRPKVEHIIITNEKKGENKDKTGIKARSQRQQAQDNAGRTVVLTGLPSSTTSKQIYKRCRRIGEIEKTNFPVEGKEEPTAHLLFKDYKDSREAVKKLDGKIFKGNNLTAVLLSREGKGLPQKSQKKSKLIVRNLPFKCTEAILKETFLQFGEVVEVSIPHMIVGKRKKKLGFGFVQFRTLFDAAKALEKMNMQKILGRPVAVDWALPKDQFVEVKMKKEEERQEENKSGGSKEKKGDPNQSSGESGEESSGEDQGEDSDQEEGEEDEKDEENAAEHKQQRSSDIAEGKTVFIRNLSFDSTEEALSQLCARFGPIAYSKIVLNHITNHSRGTGFVKFRTEESADKCIAEASNQGPTEGLLLDGHKLSIVMAVSRGKAQQLEKEKADTKKEPGDKRRLYLAREGVIQPDSNAAKDLSKADLLKRQKAEAEKKTKLANPNYFVSDTRLCVRNLPLKLGEQELRKVFSTAAGGKSARIKQVLIMRNKERLDNTGLGRPLGFGFIEFTNHSEALAALRATNNNPSLFGADRRPIVEFSIENSLALKARQQRLQRSKHKQHRDEAEQGLSPKTNREKRKEKKFRRIEKRKAKRGAQKQNPESAGTPPNDNKVDLGNGHGVIVKDKKKEKIQQRKSGERQTLKQNSESGFGRRERKQQQFPRQLKKSAPSVTTSSADPQKSPKALPNSPTKQQRKRARNKEREGKEESEFSAMVANYKNKLFNASAPAAPGAKRTRWFE